MNEENSKDLILWDAYKKGSREAFVSLFRKYYPILFSYGMKITNDSSMVDDAIQEFFLSAWRNKGKAEIQSVKGYFFKSVKFQILHAIKKSGKTDSLLSGDEEHFFEISHDLVWIQEAENQETSQRLLDTISSLSPRQKEIIYLRFYANLPYEEICEILQINYQTCRNLLSKAIQALRSFLRANAPLLFYFLYHFA